MKKTVCELFAGVGGFRCGLNGIKSLQDLAQREKWDTVWFNQWEPAEKNTQYAHDCYCYHFKTRLDKNGRDTTNCNIEDVDIMAIPDFNLLVGGFPCQDYSVAASLAVSKGLEGRKGVLWWSICKILEVKKPPFVLLENVDRLLKSPAKQRGRDFGVILSCFYKEDYTVEWRVINAAEYGYPQRRRRLFIFAYKNNTNYAAKIMDKIMYSAGLSTDDRKKRVLRLIHKDGFFAQTFPVTVLEEPETLKVKELSDNVHGISESFLMEFQNAGFMEDGKIYTVKTSPDYHGIIMTLENILEKACVNEQYFIPKERLYYTAPQIIHSDETNGRLSLRERQTWQYIKGAKKIPRISSSGHVYVYHEGAISLIDDIGKPSRTILTSEGGFCRTTHIVRDRLTGKIRHLTVAEIERLQGFPTDYTKYCMTNGHIVEMPLNKRRFVMGNALVIDLVKDMEKTLSRIFEAE